MSGRVISVTAEDQLRSLQVNNGEIGICNVSTSDISSTVSDVLRRLVSSQHLHPLVTCLIDGLEDDLGGRGTGLVLCSLLEARGADDTLTSQTGYRALATFILVFGALTISNEGIPVHGRLARLGHPFRYLKFRDTCSFYSEAQRHSQLLIIEYTTLIVHTSKSLNWSILTLRYYLHN